MIDSNGLHPPVDQLDDDGMSMLDLLAIVSEEKKLVIGLPIVAGVVALIIALVMPKWYAASTRLLPPQQPSSAALMMLGQFGPLADGANQVLGIKNPSDLYIAILKSRTVSDKLIDRFNLRSVYDEDVLSYARRELASHSTISASREGVITVQVEDKDPQRAAGIANGYIDELRELTRILAVSEAGRRRLFFEGQLAKAKHDLVDAEVALEKFSRQAGLISPQGQISVSVAAAAGLRAQIAAKEIQLSAMRTFATQSNPDMQRTVHELDALRSELAKMEKSDKVAKGDVMVPFGKASEVGLEFTRRYRELKYNETLFEILSKQYEIAKIDEAKDAPLIQVIDAAVAPDVKSRPKRLIIVTVSLVTFGIIAILIALARAAFRSAMRNPRQAERLRKLLPQVLVRRP